MLKKKNDYSVVVFFPDIPPKKWQYVHSLYSMSNFLKNKFPSWLYMNVYNRRTGVYMKRFYNGDFVPAHLNTY